MNFTPEQLEILVKGFQEHDFTQSVHLRGGVWNSEKKKEEDDQERKYNPLEMRVLSYMKRNLPALGFKRNMNNFTEKHPVNLLMSADAQYISDEAKKFFEDEEQTDAAIEQYFELFAPLIETAGDPIVKPKEKQRKNWMTAIFNVFWIG